MRNWHLIILALFIFQACGPKVELPEGAPALEKTPKLIEKAKAKSMSFKSLNIKGKGRFTENGKGQSFRYEIRIAKDSLIWVDISDPFIGLGVARGFLNKEEVAYYNRLERNYQKGKSENLAQYLGFSFDFEPMMAVLSASFLDWNQNWYQDYQPGKYQLVNYPLKADQIPPAPGSPLISQSLHPKSYRPLEYRFRRPQEGQDMNILLKEYQNFGLYMFPSTLDLTYQEGKKKINIVLEISDLSVDETLSFPFRIPPSYEKL